MGRVLQEPEAGRRKISNNQHNPIRMCQLITMKARRMDGSASYPSSDRSAINGKDMCRM